MSSSRWLNLNKGQHLICYLICLFLIGLFWFRHPAFFFTGLITGIVINCDLDKSCRLPHRDVFFHSIVLSLGYYWGTHYYLNLVTANEYAILCLLPVACHLIMDLGGVQGYGLIRFFGYAFSVKGSLVWLWSNINRRFNLCLILKQLMRKSQSC